MLISKLKGDHPDLNHNPLRKVRSERRLEEPEKQSKGSKRNKMTDIINLNEDLQSK